MPWEGVLILALWHIQHSPEGVGRRSWNSNALGGHAIGQPTDGGLTESTVSAELGGSSTMPERLLALEGTAAQVSALLSSPGSIVPGLLALMWTALLHPPRGGWPACGLLAF